MIISYNHAKWLVKKGKAFIEGTCLKGTCDYYVIVTRFDIKRTDHAKISKEELTKINSSWSEMYIKAFDYFLANSL